jgi:hypothetical protein
MRKILKILLILQILVQTTFAIDTAWYSSSQSEFTITTPEQLAGLAKLVNEGNSFEGKTVKLGANIMLNDTAKWTPIGKFISTKKAHWFMGTFDGNNFTISGIYINNSLQNQGMFERIGYSGTVKNLGITASRIKGESWAGGLAGRSYGTIINSYFSGAVSGQGGIGGLVGLNGGTIKGCYSKGTIAGKSNVVGGLVGQNAGTISNSYSSGEVAGESSAGGFAGLNKGTMSNSYSTASVTGKWKIGGLVGWNWDGAINDSYSTGAVAGESSTGGFAGDNLNGKISNSYSTGKTSGKERAGGLVGAYKGTVNNSYYNKETSGQSNSEGGEGRITVQMKQKENFKGWDFEKTWNINDTVNEGYPNLLYLQAQ